MTPHSLYEPHYSGSRALVIGIDRYQLVSPLQYAKNDAQAISDALVNRFGFPKSNVTLLLDEAATRQSIMRVYTGYCHDNGCQENDRLFVFFAGHGHTVPGRRGDIGFLVPSDGDPANLATLVRWDELTRYSDLIPAKHVFFLMDACYGGLALTRKPIPPGSMRLLRDMLQRHSRQVLTAGKGDEVVSDGNGSRPGHSIFTSRVLDALDGDVAGTDGIITANAVMAYVYDKVGNDHYSSQTPHYGFLDGDGDFVFHPTSLPTANDEPTGDEEFFVRTPTFSAVSQEPYAPTFTDQIKVLIGDPARRIQLDDLVSGRLRQAVELVSLERFPVQGHFDPSEFDDRLKRYEEAVGDLIIAVVLLAKWADAENRSLIEKIFARMAEADKGQGGLTAWLSLGWYPVLLLTYAGGIAALSARRYDTLAACMLPRIIPEGGRHGGQVLPLVRPLIAEVTQSVEMFKALPGMDRRYTPRSDYIFQVLQPRLEDLLFLGKSYENIFDQFEIFLALEFANQYAEDLSGHVWGPPGRFAWKQLRSELNPYAQLVTDGLTSGAAWEPLRYGFFRGSADRFAKVVEAYNRLLQNLNWF